MQAVSQQFKSDFQNVCEFESDYKLRKIRKGYGVIVTKERVITAHTINNKTTFFR